MPIIVMLWGIKVNQTYADQMQCFYKKYAFTEPNSVFSLKYNVYLSFNKHTVSTCAVFGNISTGVAFSGL